MTAMMDEDEFCLAERIIIGVRSVLDSEECADPEIQQLLREALNLALVVREVGMDIQAEIDNADD